MSTRPVPHDFIEQRNRLGGIMKLGAHYRACDRTVTRWIKELGLPPLPPKEPRPVPADFLEQRPRFRGINKLAEHYKAGNRTVRRWIAESGLPDMRADRTPIQPEVTQALVRNFPKMPRTSIPTVRKLNTYGPEDDAADILRAYTPVYRCNERGRAESKGQFWRVGNVVCDGDELIARAARYRRVA